MTARSMPHPEPPAAVAGIRPTGQRAAWRLLVGALVVTAVVAGWGLARSLAPHVMAPPDVLRLPGGEIHVGSERPDVMAHTTMPGMAVPDPLPEGMRRFRVGLTIVGLDGEGVAYSTEMFAVSGPGVHATRPKALGAGSGVVPPGMAASIVLLFEVPEDAIDLSLSVDGSPRSVRLPRAVTDDVGAGHEDSVGDGPVDDH